MDIRRPYDFLCNHLVALIGTFNPVDADGQPTGWPEPFIAAGCILSFRGEWGWLTAGHILGSIENKLKNPQIKGLFRLADTFGPNANNHLQIPFDYESAEKSFIDDDEAGLDYGLIALSTLHKEQMEKNHIQPITEQDWMSLNNIEFDQCFMLGFTKHFISYEPQQSPNDSHIQASVQPVVIPITKLDPPPEEFRTTYPRFVGKINDNFSLDDIRGMSGGPIFGFGKKEQNRYWIVAIQSSWLPTRRVIFGCPIQTVAIPIEAYIRATANRASDS